MRAVLTAVLLPAALAAQSDGIAYFEQNIRPLLAANCYGCHSAKLAQPMAGLLLDSQAGMMRGGKRGVPVIVPGKPEESLLIAAVNGNSTDLRMPPGKPLDAIAIQHLTAWIKMGAPDPRTAAVLPPAPAAAPAIDWEKAKQHWSFRPVTDPAPPKVASSEWSRNPIDAFIKSRLEEKGLTPQPRASRITLLRRATYDLTGLPPTPAETDAFLKDQSPAGIRKSGGPPPRQPRNTASAGAATGSTSYATPTPPAIIPIFPSPSMFRYRNWVIDAFNQRRALRPVPARPDRRRHPRRPRRPVHKNKEEWQAKIIATGYLANSRRFGSRIQEFHLTIDDTIDNLGKGILGLTIGCARCHDHKFDPIPNTDYYAIYGIFKSSSYAHAGTEIYPHTYGFVALNPDQAPELKRYETGLSGLDNRIEDMKAGRIKFPSDDEKRKAEAENQQRLRALSNRYPYFAKAYAVTEGPKPANARLMIRGEPNQLGPEVPRGFLTVLGGRKLPPEETGSGRLELAQWVTDPKNPLTARVIVNRVWLWHFGQGIAATPDDFGTRGEAPSHPELLDYLTSRFLEGGWSIKRLHRMILLSRTYQMAGGEDARDALKDPKNAFLWRFNPQRLDAEEIRDSLLADSGNLDPTPGGQQPFPPEMSWRYTQHQPFIGADKDYATNQRSVYLMQQRIRRQRFLELFDGADPNAVTGQRPLTITALQALYNMNDPFFHEQADAVAVRVGMACETEPERLNYAYRLLFGRAPTPAEVKDVRQFLAAARASLKDTAVPDDKRNREAWAAFMRVLLASNEFLSLD